MRDEESVRRMLRELWVGNRPVAMERLTIVRTAVDRLAAGDLDAAMRDEARAEAHKLRGVLGTYGFAEASVVAGEAEDVLASEADEADVGDLALRLAACAEELGAN